MDLIKEAIAILSIDSVTSNGSSKIVDYLDNLLKSFGLKSCIQETTLDGVTQKNLICRMEAEGSDEVVFNTHLDTVPAGEHKKWSKMDGVPFKAKVDGDKIYGLGSADVKLDYLCKLKALLKYKDKAWKNPLTLVGTFGEEVGLIGCDYFLKSGFIKKPKYVFVGEPTDLNIVHAHKGMVVIDFNIPFSAKGDDGQGKIFELEGIAAHGSTPHLGKNAIMNLYYFLKEAPLGEEVFYVEGGSAINVVPDLCTVITGESKNTINSKRIMSFLEFLISLEKDMQSFKDTYYDPPYPVINLGIIRSEEGNLKLKLAIRTMPGYDIDNAISEIQKTVSLLNGSFDVSMELLPMMTDKDSTIVKRSLKIINDINKSSTIITKPALTEGTLYNKYGAQCIVFGAGSTDNIHKPNEYNSISEINKSVSFYEKVIEDFCL